ncbi:hypothetical protein B0H17DRAFT_1154224 [Mycena rosella]|uniref:Uncharacterized protein n=1 Tax=Mycena rosella TaxID=1033263 RepID=A0AAD7AZK1_MYCRO|nr:hypothetical protein B0H17DRAFT_1154224 [Mycena rosella]
MRRFLREALGPVLDALLTLSPPDATRYLDLIQTAHDVRETFQSLAETLEKRQFGGSAAAASALMSELDAVLGGKQDEQNLDSTATDLTAVDPAAITGSPLTEANLVTHTADVATPSFDYRRGRPIARAWSSSSGSRASSSDSYEVLYDRPRRLAPPLQNHLSPAITEWSVTSSDFRINPNNVINEAVSRAFADLEHEAPTSLHFVDPSNNVQSLASHEESLLLSVEDVRPILESFHHDTAHSDSANSSLPADASEILTAAADSAGQPSLFQSGEATSARIYSDLRDWVQRGVEHQDEHIRAENRVCGAPLQHVLEVVHRDLRDMVDYTAMAAQDLAHFRSLSSVASTLPPLPGSGIPPSNSPPSTTFEYTELSTPPSASTDSGHDFESATASRIKNSSVTRALTDLTENLNQSSGGDAVAESATSDTIGNKRRMSEEEKEVAERGRPMKRFRKYSGDALRRTVIQHEAYKSTGFLDSYSIQLVAGVRLGILEGAQRLETMVLHRYGIHEVFNYFEAITGTNYVHNPKFQRHFPSHLTNHPLLNSIEAAKAHAVCCVFAEHRRYELLTPFQECLNLRFKNEYTLSRLLASSSFHDQYAGAHTRYWELLPSPEGAYYEYEDSSYYTSSDESFPYASSDDFPYPDSEYDPRASPVPRDSESENPNDLPALEPIPNLHYATTPTDSTYTESDAIDATAAETLFIQLPPHETPLRVRNALTLAHFGIEAPNPVEDTNSVGNRAVRTDHIINVRRTHEWDDGGGSYTDWTVDDEQQAIAI